jgi:hypothetical protein
VCIAVANEVKAEIRYVVTVVYMRKDKASAVAPIFGDKDVI